MPDTVIGVCQWQELHVMQAQRVERGWCMSSLSSFLLHISNLCQSGSNEPRWLDMHARGLAVHAGGAAHMHSCLRLSPKLPKNRNACPPQDILGGHSGNWSEVTSAGYTRVAKLKPEPVYQFFAWPAMIPCLPARIHLYKSVCPLVRP